MPRYRGKYFLAFVVSLVAALAAMGGAEITILARTHPDLAVVLGAGMASMLLFVRVLPSATQIVTPPAEPAPPDDPAI